MIREFGLFSHWTFESFAPGAIPRTKFNAFRRIHQTSGECFELLAGIEALVMEELVVDWSRVADLTRKLVAAIRTLVDQLQVMNPVEFMDAHEWFAKVSFYVRLGTDRVALEASPPYLRSFFLDEAPEHDCPRLSDCFRTTERIRVLVTTPALFQYFIEASDLREQLDNILMGIGVADPYRIADIAPSFGDLILTGGLPQVLGDDLEIAAVELAPGGGTVDLWAFTGQGDTWVMASEQKNVSPMDIVRAWKQAVSGKYSPQALCRRLGLALADEEEGVSVVIVGSGAVASGPCLPDERVSSPDVQALRRRLDQVLPHVTELNVFRSHGEPLRPEQCRSLHDLVCLCLERGLAGIFAFAGEPARGLAGIKQMRLEIPVIINSFNLGGGLFPSAAERSVITMEDVRSIPAWSFLLGLVSPALRWPAQRHDDEVPMAHHSSYAVLSQFFMHCTLRLERNLFAVECHCGDDVEKYVHFRFKGGSGTPDERNVRLRVMRQVLGDEGFGVEVRGDYLDALRCGDVDVYLQRNLVCLGLLVAWIQTVPLWELAAMGEEKGVQAFRQVQAEALSNPL